MTRNLSPHSLPDHVSVIVVNYGTADLAIRAVQSVLAADHQGRAVDVHLVDNASPGSDHATLRAAHDAGAWGDRVTLYLEPTNHGFGRGNNLVLRALAARATPPDKVFLLNPDARLKTGVIAELGAFLDAHPRAAAVGSGIDGEEDDGHAVTAAFRFPGLISELVGAVNFGPLSRAFARYAVPLPADIGTQEVDWVAGASVMFRMSALREVDFFDPAYFLYYEETDLMLRLKRKGWQVWHLPTARVDHIAGAATGVHNRDVSPKPRPAYWFDSWRHYFTKNHGVWYARAAALACLGGTALNRVLSALRRKPSGVPRNFLRDFAYHVVGPLFSPSRGRAKQ